MSATPGIQLTAWEIGLWALLLTCAVALTVQLLRKCLAEANADAGNPPGDLVLHGRVLQRHELRDPEAASEPVTEPDAIFWNTFAGLVVIVPAVLIPALASPAVGLFLLALAVAAAVAAFSGGRKLEQIRRNRPENRPGFAQTVAQHDALVARWQEYELDPAKSIDFPEMCDARVPQTAALVRALQEAERCRSTPGTDYPRAVGQLATAMAVAEAAAGVQAGLVR
ncbi:hypothetical protein [Arthrobacter sp. NyZ413]|uniref:hypothetical protein n=1 Tax=Arthrobacter sp. NyZ413 TaxID=3144669 RepID=UPI003BF7A5E9